MTFEELNEIKLTYCEFVFIESTSKSNGMPRYKKINTISDVPVRPKG